MRPFILNGAVFCACVFLLAGTVSIAQATDGNAGPQGKSVTLRVGEGFSVARTRSLAGTLEDAGCPTSVTSLGGIPDKLIVEVGQNSHKAKSVGSAETAAKKWCLTSEGG